jgi:hypothetical protein
LPTIFGVVYEEKPGIAGLHYLALGVGLSGASQVNARTLDKVYGYFKSKNGGVGRPEFRLRQCIEYFTPACSHLFVSIYGSWYNLLAYWSPDYGLVRTKKGILAGSRHCESFW